MLLPCARATMPNRKRRSLSSKSQTTDGPELIYRNPGAGDELSDQEILESWVTFLRRRADDLYYSRRAREAFVTLLLALLVGLLVAWGLARA